MEHMLLTKREIIFDTFRTEFIIVTKAQQALKGFLETSLKFHMGMS